MLNLIYFHLHINFYGVQQIFSEKLKHLLQAHYYEINTIFNLILYLLFTKINKKWEEYDYRKDANISKHFSDYFKKVGKIIFIALSLSSEASLVLLFLFDE